MAELQEQVALVTGAGRGIGAATARRFAALGAAVVLNDIDEEAVATVVAELSAHGAAASYVTADVTTGEGAQAVVAAAMGRHGRLDALVNNAGGSGSIGRPAPRTLSVTDWPAMLDSFQRNVAPMFQCTAAAVAVMRPREYGRIVNVASLAGRSRSMLAGPAYAAAKAAVIGFTRHVSAELAQGGITINAVAPGLTFTDRVQASFERRGFGDQESMMASIPLGRAASPDDQAAAIVFLSSPAAGYITGAVLDVNGGVWVG